MFVRCKESGDTFIVDTDKKKVYEVIDGEAEMLDTSLDNFLRFRPYLEVVEENSDVPEEIIAYEKKKNGY